MENIIFTGLALFIGTIIGVVEFLKAVFDRDWRKAGIILVAGLVGALIGPMREVGAYTWLQGFVAGVAASGGITLAAYISKKD